MVTAAAVALLFLLAALAAFQLALVGGAPFGRFAWGGKHRVLPTALRIGSLSSIVIYALIAAIVAARADVVDVGVPEGWARVGCWVVTAYLLLGVAMNAASRSKPERNVMTPLCAVMCALSFVVAVS